MLVNILLVLILMMGVLFAWRATGRHKGLAALAAAMAAFSGILLLKHPVLALLAVAATVAIIVRASSDPANRS